MHISILNLTKNSIVCSPALSSPSPDDLHVLLHPQSSATQLLKRRSKITFAKHGSSSTTQQEAHIVTVGQLSSRKRIWGSLDVNPESPWNIFARRIDQGHQQLIVTPKRNLASFLGSLPDSIPLSELVLPGTHETMSLYGWPFTKCQTAPLVTQFISGIRVLDIRLSLADAPSSASTGASPKVLMAYHEFIPQFVSFKDILKDTYAFLKSDIGKGETIIMSIKQESLASDEWATAVRQEVQEHYNTFYPNSNPDTEWKKAWFLQNRVPKLGECRGKIVLFSRFNPATDTEWDGGWEGMGMKPPIWPYSDERGFQWNCGETTVRTVDWFDIKTFTKIPEKISNATAILTRPFPPLTGYPAPPSNSSPTLSIAFLSCSSFPLALPSTSALGWGWPAWNIGFQGVNERMGEWVASLLGGDIASISAKAIDTAPPSRLRVQSRFFRRSKASSSRENLSEPAQPQPKETPPTVQTRLFRRAVATKPMLAPNESEKVARVNNVIPAAVAPIPAPIPKIRGWVMLDYFDDKSGAGGDLVRMLVECNFVGSNSAQRGWFSMT